MASTPPAVTQVALPPLPVDHSFSQQAEGQEQEEVEAYGEEEHHDWLGGSTAVKYLMAGGVAGAGEYASSLRLSPPDQLVPSLADVHRTVRPAEDIPDYPTARSSRHCRAEIARYEGDHPCDNEDIR